jgi:hypothetical protein
VKFPLAGLLARVGLLLGRRGPWARLRGVGLAISTTALILGLGAFVLEGAYAHQRVDRANAIRPQLAAPGQPASLLISFDGFTESHDRPVTVISIWPLTANAPLPPGVSRWPAPGEAVLSPALAADLSGGDRTEFGKVAGIIGVQGLDVPRERRVYLRPTSAILDTRHMQRAIGFNGGEGGGSSYGVGSLYADSASDVSVVVIWTLVVPALVALSLSAGLDGETRLRRRRLLTVLGAGRGHLALVDGVEAWPAIAAGTLIATVFLALACRIDVSIPRLDAELLASDARTAWVQLALAIVGGHLLALATILAVRQRYRSRRSNSAFSPQQDRQVTRATICVLAAIATIWLPAHSTSGSFRSLTYIAGVIVVAVTLPAILGILFTIVGQGIAAWGNRSGSVGSIIGGRRLQVFPIRTTRLALGVCFAVLALGQVQLWGSMLGTQYHDALRNRAQFGAIVASADKTSYGPGVQTFLKQLGPHAEAIWITTNDPSKINPRSSSQISAPCSALKALGVSCTDRPTVSGTDPTPVMEQVLKWQTGNVDVHLKREDIPDFKRLARDHAQLVLISTNGGEIPLAHLQQEAYTLTPGGLQLSTAGQGWVTAGTNSWIREEWIIVFSLFGVAVIVIATGLVMAGDAIGSSRDTTPLAVLTERRRWIFVLAAWRTALPLCGAGTVGTLAYLVLSTGMATGSGEGSMTPSPALAEVSVVFCAVFGVVMAFWAATYITRQSHNWRPGA